MSGACLARGCETGQGQGLGKQRRLGGFSGQEEESVCSSLAQDLVGLGSQDCCELQVLSKAVFRTDGRKGRL